MRSRLPILLTAAVPSALADWQYLSCPDLSPPILNITVPAHSSVEPGYLFVAQYPGFTNGSVGPEQQGGYIFRDDGDLVWSSLGYLAGWVADVGITVVNGQTVLRAFEGSMSTIPGRMYGHSVILNDRYERLKTVQAAAHQLGSGHEFQVVDGGRSALIETPVTAILDLSAFGGDEEQRWILSSGFQEVDISTGELIFEWYSADHVTPKYSATPLQRNGPFSARSSVHSWDYFHLNSVEKDPEGNYLISARNYAALFKINGTNGEVIWQLGGTNSDFTIPENAKFAFQHDARSHYLSDDGRIERISLFDNAAQLPGIPGISPFSRGRYIELDHSTRTVREVRTYRPPDDLLAHSQGNVQLLPGGNVFVNWGQAGAVTEYSEDGEVLFHAYLDSEPNRQVESYRGFRFPWTGYSPEDPAVLALSNSDVQVSVYVSWNGDTVTDVWSFYLVDGEAGSEKKYLGKAKRTGFETTFRTEIKKPSAGGLTTGHIVAEARDAKGNVLGRSRATGLTDQALYISSDPVLRDRVNIGSGFDKERLEL